LSQAIKRKKRKREKGFSLFLFPVATREKKEKDR